MDILVIPLPVLLEEALNAGEKWKCRYFILCVLFSDVKGCLHWALLQLAGSKDEMERTWSLAQAE